MFFYQVQTGSDISGEAANDLSGDSVTLSDDRTILTVGLLGKDDNGNESRQVRIYDLSPVLSPEDFVFNNTNIYPKSN